MNKKRIITRSEKRLRLEEERKRKIICCTLVIIMALISFGLMYKCL